MLEQIKSTIRRMVKDVQPKLSAESAAAIEKLDSDIGLLNDFIVRELVKVESNTRLDDKRKKDARRSVFEEAARKLEVIKASFRLSNIDDSSEVKLPEEPVEEKVTLLQFLREREVRDRLFGMSEAQILSLFGETLFDGSNTLLLNAILNAPEGFEPVSKEMLQKIRQAGAVRIKAQRGIESVRTLDDMVEKIFGLVKKELDNLRRKELPKSLAESKGPGDRPFKF